MSSHTLLGEWLLIHGWIKPCLWHKNADKPMLPEKEISEVSAVAGRPRNTCFVSTETRKSIVCESCVVGYSTSWRNQIETFPVLLAPCEGNPPVTGGFPSQRPVMRSFDVFFDPRLNTRLSTQPRRRWFETPSRSLSRHCNVMSWYHTVAHSNDVYRYCW